MIDESKILKLNSKLNKNDQAKTISRHSKLITQFKFELATAKLEMMQTMMRTIQTMLDDVQQKLCDPHYNNDNTMLIETIRERELSMRDYHKISLEHQLNTFFDDAPMTSTIV